MQKYKFFINTRKIQKNNSDLVQKDREKICSVLNTGSLFLLIQNNPESCTLADFGPFNKDFSVVIIFDYPFCK
jgi:hypothetical protein